MPLEDRTILQMDQVTLANEAFYGTSENAVKTQIWIAVSIYLPVAIIKKELNLPQSLYKILQILSIMIFQKDLNTQVLTKDRQQNEDINFYKQLSLFDL
jgi:hypothetical protein